MKRSCGDAATAAPRTHLATRRSHSSGGQKAGLFHRGAEASFVYLVVLMNVAGARALASGFAALASLVEEDVRAFFARLLTAL
jgi:hypothetical protein